MTRKELFRYIFWEWIEPIGSALGIALLVMQFVMALYVIPTGSMQPTLHGANDYGTGDKVLVNKFIYRFEEPQRWDVIVFDYPFKSVICDRCQVDAMRDFPMDEPEVVPLGLQCQTPSCQGLSQDFSFMEKEYIKRCVAVPGDELSLRDGDIALKKDGVWKPSVKTQVAQEALWVPAFDSEEHLGMSTYFWKGQGSEQAWREGEPPVLKAGGDRLVFIDKEVLRGYGDKSRPEPRGHGIVVPLVGDVALELEPQAWPREGELELEISRNLTPHRLLVDFSKKTWSVNFKDQRLATGALPAEASLLRFSRVDGHLQLLLGEELQRWPIPDFKVGEMTKSIFPKLRYQGAAPFALERLRVLRDIYYVNTGHEFFRGSDQSYKVRAGEYFAMGDNSFFSFDSRDWGPVQSDKLIGKALVVLFPPSRTKFIH